MKNNRWIWIGCGGCLGVVILGILVIVAVGTMGYRYAKNVEKNMEAWEAQMQAINQAYPFTPPEDNQIPGDRFNAFLAIREKTIAAAEQRLDWLFQFIQSPEKPSGFATIGLGFNFLNFFATLSEIGVEMSTSMTQEKMSMKEYAYLTRATMGTIYLWGQDADKPEHQTIWDRYMQPVNDLANKIEGIKKGNPDARIDVGPLDLDQIVTLMKEMPSPPPETMEILFVQRDRIASSTSALFVDFFIVQNN